jgi:hypothetical protein
MLHNFAVMSCSILNCSLLWLLLHSLKQEEDDESYIVVRESDILAALS